MTDKKSLEEILRNLGKKSLEDELRHLDKKEYSLKDKLLRVIQNFTKELKNKGMEYGRMAFYLKDQLIEQRIISKKDNDYLNAGIGEDLKDYLKQKLPIDCFQGIRRYYAVLDSGTLAEEFQKDVDELKEIQSKVKKYIQEYEGKPSAKEFKEFIYAIFPSDLDSNDKYKLYLDLISEYNLPLFKKEEEPKKFPKEDIFQELKNLDLKKELGDY